jgi:hypothetical protein
MYVTYHFEGSFVILKWNLHFFFYDISVNAFNFHKYLYIFELIKLNKT